MSVDLSLLGNIPIAMTHHFIVVVDNPMYDLGTWSKVQGLKVSWNQCEHRTGDMGNQSWSLPGTTKYERIKLSRAACPDSQVVQQWLAATSFSPTPLSGTIMLLDVGGMPLVHWQLNEFFPVAWSIVDFDSDQGKPAIETLELVHGGFLADETAPS
jgi:phage tail-like protein